MDSSRAYSAGRNGAALFYAGWAGFALFGTLVTLGGHADLPYALTHVLLATGICAWHAKTTGRAAPIAALILGTLFTLQMVFFVISSATTGESLTTVLEDAFGLVAGVLILAGSGLGIPRLARVTA